MTKTEKILRKIISEEIQKALTPALKQLKTEILSSLKPRLTEDVEVYNRKQKTDTDRIIQHGINLNNQVNQPKRTKLSPQVEESLLSIFGDGKQFGNMQPKKYSDDSILNEILNSTRPIHEQEQGDYGVIGGMEFDSDLGDIPGITPGGMINVPMMEGHVLPITENSKPVLEAMNRDYSQVLKAMDKAAKQSRGI